MINDFYDERIRIFKDNKDHPKTRDATTLFCADHYRALLELSERRMETLACVMVDTKGKVVVTDADRLKALNANITTLLSQTKRSEKAIRAMEELGGQYMYKLEDRIGSSVSSPPQALRIYRGHIKTLQTQNHHMTPEEVLKLPAAIEFRWIYEEVCKSSEKNIAEYRAELAEYQKVLESVA